jgi:hypothetical protein
VSESELQSVIIECEMCSKWEDNIKMNAAAGAVLVLEMALLLGEGPTGQACECTAHDRACRVFCDMT